MLLGLFGLTLFLSSALLFVVEPMVAKMVLPKLGGTPSVWNVCMLFFQTLLLAGYAYAHQLAKWLTLRRAVLIQLLIVSAALFVLPIHLPQKSAPTLMQSPTLWLLTLLATGVGLPFLVLTSYSSTLQSWYASAFPASANQAYVLYSASNMGSLLGLFSYPAIIERYFGLTAQSLLWEWGYLLLLVLTGCCALALWFVPAHPNPAHGAAAVKPVSVPRVQELRWLALAFIPSSLMLGVTTALTSELPPIPLLWILPLAVYLLSFVLVFARKPISWHDFVIEKLPIVLVVMAFVIAAKVVSSPLFSIPFYTIVLFLACIACHGELALRRPPAEGLTRFYLCLAFGGALGGVFNALLAPLLFKSVIELPLVLFLLTIALAYMGSRRQRQPLNKWDVLFPLALVMGVTILSVWLSASRFRASPAMHALAYIVPVLFCLSFAGRPLRFALGFAALVLPGSLYSGDHVLLTTRSFFGVYRVFDEGPYRQLSHGSTLHGMQSLDPRRTREPLSYYYKTGPIGEAFTTPSIAGRWHEIAVIGLGAGSLACYAEPGRRFTFYEIDPAVVAIARSPEYFTFLRDCSPETRIVLGDARISLQDAPGHKFDLLVADAFSSDTVPVHLVTKEAIALYVAKLADHGLLAFNIGNRYLDLRPVLGAIAHDAGLECIVRADSMPEEWEQSRGKRASVWVLMARARADFAVLAAEPNWHPLQAAAATRVWTDDYSTLAGIMHWTGNINWN